MRPNILIALFLFISVGTLAQKKAAKGKGVEPDAGNWATIVIASSKSIPVPPPPGKDITRAELRDIIALQKNRDSLTRNEIQYWNAGPPMLRWQRIADNLNDTSQYWLRVYAYMNVAIYDAIVAGWNAKYTYNRERPYQASSLIQDLIPISNSPSYPCEHAVTAGAAATVLGYLFPSKKDSLYQLGKKAGFSRVAAGVQYPSDVEAGFELGVKVAQQVIERAKLDGYDKMASSISPVGRQYYTGRKIKRDLGNMKTWVLTSPSQFRSPPPPDIEADMDELKKNRPDHYMKSRAFLWEFNWPWGDILDRKILEYNLSSNTPRAAFVYALVSISDYDNQIAHWDGKLTYFRARPDQYDTTFAPLFITPVSPSYPAGHGTMAFTRATVLSYLFPQDRQEFFYMANEANDSRFHAGVHYRTDNEAGKVLGMRVGEAVVKWAEEKIPEW